MSYLQLFRRYSRLNLREFAEFKTAFFLGVFSQIISLVLNLMFWGVIYSFTSDINGWAMGQVIMLQGFFQLHLVFFWFFFHFSEHMDELIIHGRLDRYLVNPTHPIITYMFRRMSFFSSIRLGSAALYFWVSVQLGASIALPNFIFGVTMVFLGSAILALILMTVGMLSFWIGRTEAMNTIFETMWEIGGYPLTIFPLAAQFVLTVGIPVIFLQTYPALFTMQQIDWFSFSQLLLLEIVLIIIWIVIVTFMWKKGLKRYSSYGG